MFIKTILLRVLKWNFISKKGFENYINVPFIYIFNPNQFINYKTVAPTSELAVLQTGVADQLLCSDAVQTTQSCSF